MTTPEISISPADHDAAGAVHPPSGSDGAIPPPGDMPSGSLSTSPLHVDSNLSERLSRLVRNVADFPGPGVLFKDITPVLADHGAFAAAVNGLAAPFRGTVDVVAAIEARGFIFGAPVAVALGVGLVPLRKVGKLPGPTVSESYALEYGTATLEMHADALVEGQRVLLVDDVIATGGTAAAARRLADRAGATVVGVAALIELTELDGRRHLHGIDIHVLLRA